MRYRVLGPLEAETDSGPVRLVGQKERLLLALLLTRPNQVVPVEALVAGLWGEHPPATAAKTLQSHVVRLRRALEPARARGAAGEVLVTRDPGYLLRVAPGALDATRFEELTGQARRALSDGKTEDAALMLREALGLWRGRAFEGFLDADVGTAESDRLAELRLGALEDRIEADLRLGRHRELVAELEGLVRDQPLRERLWAQLLLALYRSGRQADALLAYQRARGVLVEELGIDPGGELRRLHAAILAQDPGLELPAEAGPSPDLASGQEQAAQVLSLHETAPASWAAVGAEEPTASQAAGGRGHLRLVGSAQVADEVAGRREFGGDRRVVSAGRRRSRGRLAVAGLVVALLVAAALVADRIADRDESVAGIASNSLGLIGLKAGTLVGQVPLEARSGQVAVGDGAVWVANSLDNSLSRIDASSGRPVATIPVGGSPSGVAAGLGAVWVTNAGDNTVARISPSSNAVVRPIPVGNGPKAIAVGA